MRNYPYIILILILVACSPKESADMIITNGSIYTVDDQSPTAETVVIKDKKIIYVGDADGASKYEGQKLDLEGKTMFPGFHEGHAHLMGVGYNLINVDLMSAQSYTEVIEMVKERAANTPEGEWIVGRGWHQDKWIDQPERMFKNLPTHFDLTEAIPDHPVWLRHASGHMALANAKAMELAGITNITPQPDGGEIFMDLGGPTGIFNETAMDVVYKILPSESKERASAALNLAVDECLKMA